MTFGDLLQSLRSDRGLTQERLADISGVALGSLRNHEQGLSLPTLPHALQLARALNVSVEVLTDCDEMRPPAGTVANDGKKGARS